MDNGKKGELTGTYHMGKEHGRLARRLSGEQPGLGRVVAQVFRHVRVRKFRAALADARQVVTRGYPASSAGSARWSGAWLSFSANHGEIAMSQVQETGRSGFDTVVGGLPGDVRTLVRQEMTLARHEVQYEIGKIHV